MKWFKHDTDSLRNSKIRKVVRTHGTTGYAIWWAILERLYAVEGDFQAIANDLWLEDLAEDLKISDHRTLIRVFDTFAEVNLISPQLWAEHVIHIEAIVERGDAYIDRRVYEREKKQKQRSRAKIDVSLGDKVGTKGQSAVLSPSEVRIQNSEDPEFLSSSSSVVPKDVGVSFDTTPPVAIVQSEIPSKQESPATETGDKESSLADLKSSDRIGGSAAKKTGAGSRKAAAQSKAAKVYSTLREPEKFENLWVWYCRVVKERDARPGDKAAAAIAWRDVIEADWERFEEFRRGCSLFFKGRIESGIPHLSNFIGGSTKHPTPYWQTALDDAAPAKATADSFIPESKTSPQIFTAKPFETNPSDAVDGLARMKAAMKQTKQELEAKNGLSA